MDAGTPLRLELRAFGWPEVAPGDDLVALVAAADDLRDGDVVVVTSKVISKAEGRAVAGSRADAVVSETRRVVARRGATVISETRHGLVLAAAGVDASNTPEGTALLLPRDPDATAAALRAGIFTTTGRNVAVVVSDTAGRAWRVGQTDLAVGCAGLAPLVDLAGTLDTHGNVLQVTAPAVADEVAAAADLVKGKTSGRPAALVRGLAADVLPVGEDGPGARALVRGAEDDLFALGTREAAVAAALRDDPVALARFPRTLPTDQAPFAGLLAGWQAAISTAASRAADVTLVRDACPDRPDAAGWTLRVALTPTPDADLLVAAGRLLERADVLAAGHRMVGHDHVDRRPDPRLPTTWTRCWQDQ